MVLSFLLLLKMMLFIFLTKIEYNKVLVFIVSSLYIIFFFSLIYFSHNKKKQSIAFSFYNIISAIMFVDVVYYQYFNGLPSVNMVKQLGQVAQVSESVKTIINPLNLLFILDIPVLCFYSSKKKKKIKRENKIYSKNIKTRIPYAIVSALAILAIVMNTSGYSSIINGQEFFTYHAKDLTSLFKGSGDVAVGESVFTEHDLQCLKEQSILEDRKYTGIGKDKNLIVIQVEALQNFAINRYYEGQELTPNLNKFIKENGSIYFDRYYQLVGIGSTSDAEFVTNNSLYPSMDEPSYIQYQDNTFYGLPWILRDKGYTAWSFHGYKKEFWNRDKSYPKQGFERYVNEEDFELGDIVALGLNDEDFFHQSMDYIKEMDEPFYAFMITLSSHNPFNMPEEYQEIQLKQEHKDTLFGNYLQAVHYADKAIGEFFNELKKEGIYGNSIIALYGDHFAISSLEDENIKIMSEYLDIDYDFDSMMNIPLIVHVPGEDINETVSTVGSQLDFLPTILNIMGIENEKGIMFGLDLLNSEDQIVAQQIHMRKGSFIDDEKMFVMSRDGIFDHSRAIDLKTRKSIPLEECREGYGRAISEIDKSKYILNNDLIGSIINGSDEIIAKEPEEKLEIQNKNTIGFAADTKAKLDEYYEDGLRLMEVDLEWTTDERLIVNCDNGMTVEELEQWMEDHTDAYIITDMVGDNSKAMKYIKYNLKEVKTRFIPQVKDMEEYYLVYTKGFKNIIFKIPDDKYTDKEILEFVKLYDHFGIAISEYRANRGLLRKLQKQGLTTYIY